MEGQRATNGPQDTPVAVGVLALVVLASAVAPGAEGGVLGTGRRVEPLARSV